MKRKNKIKSTVNDLDTKTFKLLHIDFLIQVIIQVDSFYINTIDIPIFNGSNSQK